MKIQSQFVFLACLGLVMSQAEYYCGRRLAIALDHACDGHLIKRSGPQLAGWPLGSSWPWLDASRARGLSLSAREKRGAVDECCLKPCTHEELITYCH